MKQTFHSPDCSGILFPDWISDAVGEKDTAESGKKLPKKPDCESPVLNFMWSVIIFYVVTGCKYSGSVRLLRKF